MNVVVPVRSVRISRDVGGRVSALICVGFRLHHTDDERELYVSTADVEAAAMLAEQLVTGPATWSMAQAVLDAAWMKGGGG